MMNRNGADTDRRHAGGDGGGLAAAVDEGSLARAGRKLGRSPAAISRAVAALESRLGVCLLHRSTRSVRPSLAGERYHAACRRMIDELDEAERAASEGRTAPGGRLTLTAPVLAGEVLLRPALDAFMDAHPAVSIRLHLHDQPMNLIEDGFDAALRIAHLPDSTSVGIPLGKVRRVVVAAPSYLATRPPINEPADLWCHAIIAMAHFGSTTWSFPPRSDASHLPRLVRFTARFDVNSAAAAIASAVAGHGVTRLFSYHVAPYVRDGRLAVVLEDHEPAPLPVHLLSPQGRLSLPALRAFTDFAVPRLREGFAALGAVARQAPPSNRPDAEGCASSLGRMSGSTERPD